MGGQASRDNRREKRVPVECRASARIALCVEILDASSRGVRARISVPLPVGATLKIGLPGGAERHARVAWAEGGLVGCEFMAPLDPKDLVRLLAGTVPAWAGRTTAAPARFGADAVEATTALRRPRDQLKK